MDVDPPSRNDINHDDLSGQNGVMSSSGDGNSLSKGINDSSSLTGKFEQLAGTIFQHCNEALSHDFGDAYDVPQYPIAENQQKGQIVHQISKREYVKLKGLFFNT